MFYKIVRNDTKVKGRQKCLFLRFVQNCLVFVFSSFHKQGLNDVWCLDFFKFKPTFSAQTRNVLKELAILNLICAFGYATYMFI